MDAPFSQVTVLQIDFAEALRQFRAACAADPAAAAGFDQRLDVAIRDEERVA